MSPDSSEMVVPEITDGRWLIVADTLETAAPAETRGFFQGLDFLIAVAEDRRRIGLCLLGTSVLALAIAFLMPNTYTATTQLLPPQASASAVSAMLGQFGELASLAGKDVVRNPSAIFVVLLRSRTVAERLIERFELMKAYGARRVSTCRKRLEKVTQIEATKEGVIIIDVEDRDPRRAAQLASGYVEELARLNQGLAVGEAARRRAFFEVQVQEAREQLAKAEDDFRQVQERTGMIQLDTQAKATIEAAAILRAHIALKQAELQRIRAYVTDQNPEARSAAAELAALQQQLRLMREPGGTGDDLEVPVSRLPAAGLEYIRRLRDVKYYEAVFATLSKQLEAARIDEAREGTLIQVIDPAEVPDHRSGPRRWLIILLGAAAGLAGSLVWTVARTAWARAHLNPSQSAQMAQLKKVFGFSPAE